MPRPADSQQSRTDQAIAPLQAEARQDTRAIGGTVAAGLGQVGNAIDKMRESAARAREFDATMRAQRERAVAEVALQKQQLDQQREANIGRFMQGQEELRQQGLVRQSEIERNTMIAGEAKARRDEILGQATTKAAIESMRLDVAAKEQQVAALRLSNAQLEMQLKQQYGGLSPDQAYGGLETIVKTFGSKSKEELTPAQAEALQNAIGMSEAMGSRVTGSEFSMKAGNRANDDVVEMLGAAPQGAYLGLPNAAMRSVASELEEAAPGLGVRLLEADARLGFQNVAAATRMIHEFRATTPPILALVPKEQHQLVVRMIVDKALAYAMQLATKPDDSIDPQVFAERLQHALGVQSEGPEMVAPKAAPMTPAQKKATEAQRPWWMQGMGLK